jgi:hypothetical protein
MTIRCKNTRRMEQYTDDDDDDDNIGDDDDDDDENDDKGTRCTLSHRVKRVKVMRLTRPKHAVNRATPCSRRTSTVGTSIRSSMIEVGKKIRSL